MLGNVEFKKVDSYCVKSEQSIFSLSTFALNANFKVQKPQFKIENTKTKILKMKFKIESPKTKIRNLKFKT